ncbi:uncharacterized protein NPIL_379381 [Nephila pilipes]|uniref:Cardioactive peptide n=1 Tax=Nephila pilipes TaxID=299642 RepID=A0A8X6MZ49_NEPPI|nr:uncharacterized protein NPIL_379381 [Nephila pilipes]
MPTPNNEGSKDDCSQSNNSFFLRNEISSEELLISCQTRTVSFNFGNEEHQYFETTSSKIYFKRMVNSTCLTFIILSALAIIFTVASDSLDQDRMDLPVLQKRPFCNAFTGCGRKRSNLRGGDNSDLFGSRQVSQNKLYAMLQQKMAEVEALRGILDENNK